MQELVKDSIKEINEDLEIVEFENITDETKIFENIDSVAVLDLVLEIEDKLQKKYGKYIQIADDKTMDIANTPFKDFKTLVSYLEEKINGTSL